MCTRHIILLTLSMFLLPVTAFGGTSGEGKTKNIQAIRVSKAPVLDGLLTEEIWQKAPVVSDFTQNFPNDGAKPTFQTEVRVVYTKSALYIGVKALDDEPSKIVQRLGRRDVEVESDAIRIFLDPRHDHDSGFTFWINAA